MAREQQILQKAIDEGLVRPELVDAARRRQQQPDAPSSALAILLEEGQLTREQVIELVTGKPAREFEPPPGEPAPEPDIEEIPVEGDEEAPEELFLEEAPPEETAPAADQPALEDCELVEDLGTGPLATACVLRDPAGTRYVLKVLHSSVAQDGSYVAELERQASTAAKLDDPHIARVVGWGTFRGDVYVLSEYVEGASLLRLLKSRGKLEPEEALAIAFAAASALERARVVGLHHGAVTPSNILIAQEGATKLTDLGLPKPPPEEFSRSRTGPGVRSPYYLAPEHVRGGPLDTRSDLFSLGACLYHALTGSRPFQGDTTAEVAAAVEAGNMAPVRELAPDVPRAFAAIVEKLLQPDPEQRYATPRELMDDLSAYHGGKVPAAQRAAVAAGQQQKARERAAEQQAAAGPQARPSRRRWPWVAAGAAAAAALVVAIILASRPSSTEPEEKSEVPVEITDPVKHARKGREEIEQAVEAYEPKEGEERAAAEKAVQDLEAIQEKYKGTEVAEEAAQRLRPFKAEALFQQAVAFAREHPDQRDAAIERFRKVVAEYGDTEAAYKAERELDELEGVARKKHQRRLEEVRKRAATLVEQQRFGDALALFNKLLENVDAEPMSQLILQEKLDITTKAERAYAAIEEQAQEKIRGQYYAEAKSLYERVVERFGVDPYVGRAKGQIAILEPLIASASKTRMKAIDAAKYEFFLVRIEPSLAHLRQWELAKAQAAAEKLRPDLQAAEIEGYLDDYLADLELLRNLKLRVVRRLNDEDRPVLAKEFSLGKVGGRFDPKWLEARVLRANEEEMVLRYGEVEVHRAWGQCPPAEYYRLARLVSAPKDPRSRLALGALCFYVGLHRTARTELNAARAAGVEDAGAYLKRLDISQPSAAPEATVERTREEEASHLFMEAKRYMNDREYDRALYRLALLKQRHASQDYDVSANLPEINRRIAECRQHVDRMTLETDLALGREAPLFRLDNLEGWQRRFGSWSLSDGILHGEVKGEEDGECLVTLRHPPSYELQLDVRVLSGTGAVVRLAGAGRPNIGFWVHAANPKLAGLLLAHASDDKPAERVRRPFAFQPKQWYTLRAAVCPTYVEVAIGRDYRVRMPNKFPGRTDPEQTYGVMVNSGSAAEFRNFTIRVLRQQ
jgi:serine/threonine-protein kinase